MSSTLHMCSFHWIMCFLESHLEEYIGDHGIFIQIGAADSEEELLLLESGMTSDQDSQGLLNETQQPHEQNRVETELCN